MGGMAVKYVLVSVLVALFSAAAYADLRLLMKSRGHEMMDGGRSSSGGFVSVQQSSLPSGSGCSLPAALPCELE